MRSVAILASFALAGCALGLTCTQMWAPGGVAVVLDGGWEAGRYQIEVQGYNQHAMCVVDLPWDGVLEPACTSNASLAFDESGVTPQRFDAVDFAPDAFVATVTLDGEEVADQVFEPEYAVDEPNGPGCGERRVATVTLVW